MDFGGPDDDPQTPQPSGFRIGGAVERNSERDPDVTGAEVKLTNVLHSAERSPIHHRLRPVVHGQVEVRWPPSHAVRERELEGEIG